MQSASAEYCLLFVKWAPTCMPRNDWAAWAQAGSVIAALALTLFLWRSDRRREVRQTVAAAHVFASRLIGIFGAVRVWCTTEYRDGMAEELEALVQLQRFGQGVKVDALPPGAVSQYFTLLALCSQGLQALSTVLLDPKASVQNLAVKLEAMQRRAGDVALTFGRATGDKMVIAALAEQLVDDRQPTVAESPLESQHPPQQRS
jgi:hypothetical protein